MIDTIHCHLLRVFRSNFKRSKCYFSFLRVEVSFQDAWLYSILRNEWDRKNGKCLIETALKKFPRSKIILSGVLPRFWDDEANQVAKQLNESFRFNCSLSQRVRFTDHTRSVLTDDVVFRNDLYWDEVHLNSKGLSRMVVNLHKTIDNWSKTCLG